jgi:DNA-binding MarR family transcriptional regulator
VSNVASSQLIDRLVDLGLIERTEDPFDRRAKQLTITMKGRSVLEQGIAARHKWMETLTTQITPEQRVTVIAALTMLTSSAARFGEEA